MFGRKKKFKPTVEYNPETQVPIIKASICNGEQVAGFKDKQTGHFTEVMLIRDEEELVLFKQTYGLSEIKKEY